MCGTLLLTPIISTFLFLSFQLAILMEEVPSSSKQMEVNFINLINSTFNIVLPQRSNSSNKQDCFCPVVFHDKETCYKLETCSCINSTIFSNSYIEICHKLEGVNHILIQNLSKNMNNTLLHIFHGFYCDTYYIPPYRIYTHQFRIFMGELYACKMLVLL